VELLDKNVGMREHELWTRLAVMRNKKVTGFVGWVTYELAKVRLSPSEQAMHGKISSRGN
jgi:CRISPR/Cas system endoribonuclease Cas6 (RAMP superfamily)